MLQKVNTHVQTNLFTITRSIFVEFACSTVISNFNNDNTVPNK